MKRPPTFAERARRISEGSRFYVDKARELVDELEELTSAADELVANDVSDALSTLHTFAENLAAFAELDLGITSKALDAVNASIEEIEGHIGSLEVDLFVDAVEGLRTAVEEVEQQRDDPSSYDAEEKSGSRDVARELFGELADRLDELAVSDDAGSTS